jgi:hypothetical protein
MLLQLQIRPSNWHVSRALAVVIGLPNGKLFFVFAAINVLNSCFGFWLPEVRISSLSLPASVSWCWSGIPFASSSQTKGLSIEEMDILFGATTLEDRHRYLDNQIKNREADASSITKKDYDGDVEYVEHSAPAYNKVWARSASVLSCSLFLSFASL